MQSKARKLVSPVIYTDYWPMFCLTVGTHFPLCQFNQSHIHISEMELGLWINSNVSKMSCPREERLPAWKSVLLLICSTGAALKNTQVEEKHAFLVFFGGFLFTFSPMKNRPFTSVESTRLLKIRRSKLQNGPL